MKKTILFDLDGTLVDIEAEFIQIFNSLASEFGYTPILSGDTALLKQLPLKKFLWRRLGWRVFLFPLILKRGQEKYHKLIPLVALFPHMKELLHTLHAHGYRLGIVSSSREDTTRALVAKHDLSVDFIYQGALFNKASSLKKVIQKEHLIADETLYVGDEVRDVEACQKTGLGIIAVTWGLNSKEALQQAGAETVDTPQELLARLMS